MLTGIMSVVNMQGKSQGALFALSDSKRKLAKIEQELAEAEELKSLKPAEMMEALAKRKVSMENKSGTKNSGGTYL
jgi:F0F1-type ATP synthase delta subunit